MNGTSVRLWVHTGPVARWQVTAFSSTDELVDWFFVSDLNPADVRRLWTLPPNVPIGELLINEEQATQLSILTGTPILLREGVELYLGLTSEYPGEAVTEGDGSVWYPPP